MAPTCLVHDDHLFAPVAPVTPAHRLEHQMRLNFLFRCIPDWRRVLVGTPGTKVLGDKHTPDPVFAPFLNKKGEGCHNVCLAKRGEECHNVCFAGLLVRLGYKPRLVDRDRARRPFDLHVRLPCSPKSPTTPSV